MQIPRTRQNGRALAVRRDTLGLLALLPAILLNVAATPQTELAGRVVGVSDGDTLTLLVDGEPQRIRLAQIDAPESGQPFGRAAKRALSELCFERDARVVVVDTDRYGRVVGEVFVAGVHVNHRMVSSGHAWAYTEYARSTEIIDLEDEARSAERGLWALPEDQREPPWLWRRRGRKTPGRQPRAAPLPPGCGPPRSCAEISSCEDARIQLERCGRKQLDGDGDGVPCEQLCSGG